MRDGSDTRAQRAGLEASLETESGCETFAVWNQDRALPTVSISDVGNTDLSLSVR